MPLDFPLSPALNQVYFLGGKSWKWNGAAWETYNDNLGVDFVETVNGITGDVSVIGGTDISVSSIGKNLTVTYTGSNVSNSVTSLSGLTGTVGITGGTDISVSISGQTLTVNYTGSSVSNVVSSFNGVTGAVQGVSAAVAGTGIAVSGTTGTVTITNVGVISFNGTTGAVTGVTVGGVNTFTSLNSFNSGISANGATLSNAVVVGNLAVTRGITLNSLGSGLSTGIFVERGVSADVGIRWNETTDRWQHSADGTNWYNLPLPTTTVNPIVVRDSTRADTPVQALSSEANAQSINVTTFYNSSIRPQDYLTDTVINGDRWFNNTTGKLFTWITQPDPDTGLTGAWVEL